MPQIAALTTVDYEIFGDGSGSIHETLVAKTDFLLDCFRSLGIKATFFVEIEEIYRFRTDKVEGWDLIEQQLTRIISEGHEVALHVHPQWIEAEYDRTAGQYIVDDEAWKMDKVFQGKALTEYLTSRRSMLTELLFDLGHSVEIVGFRAGGYNVGDPATNAGAIQAAGLSYDASVVVGATAAGPYSEYDFSKNTRPQEFGSGINAFSSIPISSFKYNKAAYFTPSMLKRGQKPKLRVSKGTQKVTRLAKIMNILKINRGPVDFVLLPTWLVGLAVLTSRGAGYIQVVGHNKSVVSEQRVYKNLKLLAKLFDTSRTLKTEHKRLATGYKGHAHGH